MDYVPMIKGVAIGVFLAATMNETIATPEWWVAMIALNVMANA